MPSSSGRSRRHRGSPALAQASQDTTHLVAADWMLGSTYNLIGQQRLALQLLEQGTARAEASGLEPFVHFAYDSRLRSMIRMAWTYWLCGLPDRASKLSMQLLEKFTPSSDPVSHCIVSLYLTPVILWLGDLERAERAIESLMGGAAKYHLKPYWTGALALKGKLLLARGQTQDAVDLLGDALEPLRTEKLNIMVAPTLRARAEGLARAGRVEEAQAIINRLVESAEASEPTYLLPELLRTQAGIILAAGAGHADVEILYRKAIARARHDGAVSWELRAANSLARLWIEAGQEDRARPLLDEALGMFTEGFNTGDLLEAKQLLEQC